jgi:ATP-dependent Zn protease
MPRSDARDERIIYHELGHAVVGRALGDTVEFVTVEPQVIDGRLTNGSVRWIDSLDDDDFNRCVVLVAAGIAERMFCGHEGKLRGTDREKAMEHAGAICETVDGINHNHLIRAARAVAERILTKNRPLVEALAPELRIRRTMSGSELEECIADIEAARVARLWLSAGIYRPAKGASEPGVIGNHDE